MSRFFATSFDTITNPTGFTRDLVSGTLRSNLDPFGLHHDARLWDALKRAYIVDQDKNLSIDVDEKASDHTDTPGQRFTLDSPVDDEGANLSIGQRSLVSLARALVKDSKIIILDEATASVDYETDKNIQATIANEFRDRTILCIARAYCSEFLTTKPQLIDTDYFV